MFDVYFDKDGKLFTRAEGSAFKRQIWKLNPTGPEKVLVERPLWAVINVFCVHGRETSIEIKSWVLGRPIPSSPRSN